MIVRHSALFERDASVSPLIRCFSAPIRQSAPMMNLRTISIQLRSQHVRLTQLHVNYRDADSAPAAVASSHITARPASAPLLEPTLANPNVGSLFIPCAQFASVTVCCSVPALTAIATALQGLPAASQQLAGPQGFHILLLSDVLQLAGGVFILYDAHRRQHASSESASTAPTTSSSPSSAAPLQLQSSKPQASALASPLAIWGRLYQANTSDALKGIAAAAAAASLMLVTALATSAAPAESSAALPGRHQSLCVCCLFKGS